MDFFANKIATLFTRFDMDKNGKIEEDDFDRWSETLIAIGHLNAADSVKEFLFFFYLFYPKGY